MGAIFPDTVVQCTRCGNNTKLPESSKETTAECIVCKSLGDRALVPLMRNPSPEALKRFLASPPGSVLFNASLMRRGKPQYGSWKPFEGDPRHERG